MPGHDGTSRPLMSSLMSFDLWPTNVRSDEEVTVNNFACLTVANKVHDAVSFAF